MSSYLRKHNGCHGPQSPELDLLERIALLEDEARLLAQKRLLDAPRGYGMPDENPGTVNEEPYTLTSKWQRASFLVELRVIVDAVREEWSREDLIVRSIQRLFTARIPSRSTAP